MAGVISPSSASAMTMPKGPAMTSARRQPTSTAFSPVAALSAPARSMAAVAAEFVPTAVMAALGQAALIACTSWRPMPPPCPSMTRT